MKALITVILPIYNRADCINNLIKSMINQDIGFENLELIIVDNLSTDNSQSQIKKYADKYSNIKFMILDEHYPTPGRSRNIGIEEATADYIMFCDSDDIFTSDFCKTMLGNIKTENVDFVSSRYTVNYLNGNNCFNNSFLDKYPPKILLKDIKEFPEIIQTQANLTIWNKIYLKDFLVENNIMFVEDHWAEDYLFSLECYIKSTCFLLLNDYSGYLYSVDNNQKSKTIKEDFHNNGIIPLRKAEKLLTENSMDVMPFVSEFLVTWIKIFLESDLDDNDLKDIYEEFQPWLKRYSISTRLVNIPLYLNIPINFAVKIFSLNSSIMLFAKKVFNIVRSD